MNTRSNNKKISYPDKSKFDNYEDSDLDYIEESEEEKHMSRPAKRVKRKDSVFNVLSETRREINRSDLKYKILQLNTSIENKQLIYSRYKELCVLTSKDDEYG